MTKTNLFNLLYSWALVSYALALSIWLCCQPVPPLQDYQNWVYQGWVGAHLLHGDLRVEALFATVQYPVPNISSQAILIFLNLLMGPLFASKFFIVGLIAASLALCWQTGKERSASDSSALSLVLFFCFFANSAFWNGYVNYQLSIVLLLLFLLLRPQMGTLLIAIFGLLIFACHASTFLAFVLVVLFSAFYNRSNRIHIWALLPGLSLMAWYILAKPKGPSKLDQSGAIYTGLFKLLEYKIYTFSKIGPFQNLVDSQGHSLLLRNYHLYLVGVALNLAFVCILLVGIAVPARSVFFKTIRNPLLLASVLMFVGFLVLPDTTWGVVNLGERFLYPCLIITVFSIPAISHIRALAFLCIAGMILTLAQCVTMPTTNYVNLSVTPNESVSGGPKYQRFGLYSHDLYENDGYRYFLEDPLNRSLPDLGFDTSLLKERRYPPLK